VTLRVAQLGARREAGAAATQLAEGSGAREVFRSGRWRESQPLGRTKGSVRPIEIARARQGALVFLMPIVLRSRHRGFRFDSGKSLQKELAIVGERRGVLAGNAASDLKKENFAKSAVDRGGRLEVADGGKDVGGVDVAVSGGLPFHHARAGRANSAGAASEPGQVRRGAPSPQNEGRHEGDQRTDAL
jgi:hypothetical protein